MQVGYIGAGNMASALERGGVRAALAAAMDDVMGAE
jgi:pyrroline-5-carboxylate reductase